MRRALSVCLALASTALLMTGCTKPNPGVSVWSGTQSEHLQAQCWSANAATAIDLNACSAALDAADKGKKIPTITVNPGSVLGISVDVKVADNGWVAKLGGNTLTGTKVTNTYWRFTYPQLTSLPAKNQLIILASGPTSSTYRGVWVFNTIERGVNGG